MTITPRTTAVLLLALSTATAHAGGTSHWKQTSEADFKKGTFREVVATNLGDLKLSRATRRLLEQDPKVSAVYSLAELPDGTIYAGTGPQGVLLRVTADTVETATKLDTDLNITALAADAQGKLLIGTSGERGRVLRLDKPGDPPKELFAADGVQYVWALRVTADGTIYAATGPEGQLFQINADGTHKVLFDADENNLLSLAYDGQATLYAGSDPNGIVYRIDRTTGEHFVLYDASESEVSCLALDEAGNLYAGTGDATANVTGGAEASADQTGRPEGTGGGSPLPIAPPGEPAPPNPNPPGVPEPQPRAENAPPPVTVLGRRGERSGAQLVDRPSPQPSPRAQGEGARALQEVPDDEGDGEPAAPGADAAVVTAVATAPAGEDVGTTAGDGESPANGNAVYRIDASGFVTEVFRQPVLVLSLVARNGTLLVGTGNEGFVYEVNPAADETVAVAKVDPKQVLSLLPARDGRIYLGLANVGGIAAMSSGFAPEGTYTSEAFDAGQISQFGKLQLHGALPDGAGLTVATRSGNVKDPEAGGWSKWSAELPATEFVPSAAPPARFFQYRLTLKAGAGARETPAVTDVDVAYAVPNLPPVVKSVKASLKAEEGGEPGTGGVAATPPGGRLREITWEASDPNADALQYAVSFRPLATAGPWVLLKDKLKETTYTWDTQSVADGRYQLRVVASDNAANPDGQGKTATRISDPVLVDNTPPLLSDVTTTVNGRDVRVELRAGDRNGIVSGAEYAVDSSQDWQAIAASDKLYDSPDEAASFVAKGLPPGAHVIAVRASDPMGNKGYVNVSVTIE